MARLPQVGGDTGNWGTILNEFLSVEQNADGSLKIRDDGTLDAYAQNSTVVHNSGAETITGTKTFSAPPVVPTPVLSGHAATKDYVDSTVSAGAPDANATTKGILQLTGDLGGTAASPTVPGLANKQPLNAELTTIAGLSPTDNDLLQRKSGSWTHRTPAQLKTDLALTKSDIGLSNVDNTSDATKNSATATLTNKTISGASNTLSSVPQSAVTNLPTDLAAKLDSSQLDTDSTLAANSDTRIASQKATKTYVDNQLSDGANNAIAFAIAL